MKEKMRNPLGQIIDALRPDFLKLNFSKLDESEDRVVYGDGVRSMEITSNPYDPMEVTIALRAAGGQKSALRVWEKLLDGSSAQARMDEAKRFIQVNRLRDLTIAQMREDARVHEYLRCGILSALDFLSRHFDEVFNPTTELLSEYSETSRSSLARLGIKL